MRHPALEKLLVLQDRDQRRISVEAQLARVPIEIAAVREKIAAEQSANESARTELRDLEVKKKTIETEIGSAEGQLAKYRTQQSQVRKNDEFHALGNQIETAAQAIGELEGKELEVMYGIDLAKKKYAVAEAEMKAHIAGHETRIREMQERETALRAELATALAALAEARTPLDALPLRLYDRIALRCQPVCAPIHDGTCGGCHLRVSGEADADARKGDKLATCDQCGRIIWWEVG